MKDLHTHTEFSDGANTAEEMVLAAIELGLEEYGISDHSYTDFDESYCIPKDRLDEYVREINRLKEKYADRITIRCGIEQDYYSNQPTDCYEYVIGSLHYVVLDGEYITIDDTPDINADAVERLCGGDPYILVEKYFETVADVVRKTGCDIIGHFDLICKFNEKYPMFDEHHPRYVAAWQRAADELLKTGVPFEINTGAMSRGYKTVPYPSPEMQDYIRARGGSFVLSSDTHRTDTICYKFAELEGTI